MTAPADDEVTKTNFFPVNASDPEVDEATHSDEPTPIAPDLTPVITLEKYGLEGCVRTPETTLRLGYPSREFHQP